MKEKGNRRRMAIISAILSALPSLIGAAVWAYAPKAGAMMEIPLGAMLSTPISIALVDALCLHFTHRDRGNDEQSEKIMNMVYLICPVLSLVTTGIMAMAIMGLTGNMDTVMAALIGMIFIFIGNEMPKCRRNNTIGIKVKWTLQNDENWNATHRVTAKLWVFMGFALTLVALLPWLGFKVWAFVIMLIIMTFAPVLYSWNYHKKQLEAGTFKIDRKKKVAIGKKGTIFSLVMLVLVAVFVLVMLFCGRITYELGDETVEVKANLYSDMTLSYSRMSDIEIIDGKIGGTRVFGFGSPAMNIGTFKNEEIGTYTRYTMGSSDIAIKMDYDGETMVLSAASDEETLALSEEFRARSEN